MANFADRLKILREQRGETQQDIADLLQVSKNTVSGYERGIRRPAGEGAIETYYTLAHHFNVDLDYLTGQCDHVVRVAGEGSDPDGSIMVEITPEELDLLKHYRMLDQYTRRLTRMAARMEDMEK